MLWVFGATIWWLWMKTTFYPIWWLTMYEGDISSFFLRSFNVLWQRQTNDRPKRNLNNDYNDITCSLIYHVGEILFTYWFCLIKMHFCYYITKEDQLLGLTKDPYCLLFPNYGARELQGQLKRRHLKAALLHPPWFVWSHLPYQLELVSASWLNSSPWGYRW